jgi:hypothetical protein
LQVPTTVGIARQPFAQLNGLNPEARLRHILERIADHAINKVDELLPWDVLAQVPSLRTAV